MIPSQQEPALHRGARTVRLLFSGLALGSLIIGLALYLLAERLGLDAATARLLTSAFLLAAVADALVLYFWDRLFTRKP